MIRAKDFAAQELDSIGREMYLAQAKIAYSWGEISFIDYRQIQLEIKKLPQLTSFQLSTQKQFFGSD